MNRGNRIHLETDGFGEYQGALYARDNGETLDWYWYITAAGESDHERGRYSSKAKARASINRKVKSLDRRNYLLGK